MAILIDILFIPLYRFFKFIDPRKVKSPEVASIGVIGLLFGITGTFLYQILFRNIFSRKVAGVILIITCLTALAYLYFHFIKDDRYEKIVKKYRSTWFLGLFLNAIWIYFVWYYEAHFYFKDLK